MTDYYVGIDQSYSGFGLVVVGPEGEHIMHSRAAFDPKRYGKGVDRLIAIEKHVQKHLRPKRAHVAHAVMEGYANGMKFGREQAGELGYAVKRSLSELEIYPTIAPPTSVKKFATGSGGAKKNQILLAVYKKYGFDTDSDDLADAMVMAQLARTMRLWVEGDLTEADLPKYELEVLKALHYRTEPD